MKQQAASVDANGVSQRPHGWSAPWIGMGLVLLLMIAAYMPALRGGYVWDDDGHVTRNQTLLSTGGLWRIWSDPSATPQYYPLVHTTFWIERHIWGLHPAGYHLSLIHI